MDRFGRIGILNFDHITLILYSVSGIGHSGDLLTKNVNILFIKSCLAKLEDTARYAGLLLAPAEGLGRGFFWAKKKK
jgi:hypothetical protein